MGDSLTQLKGLYGEYLRDMERLAAEHYNLRGAFGRIFGGSAAGPGADSCNDRFYEGVSELTRSLADEGAPPEEIAEVIGCMIRSPGESLCGQSALLMLQAAQGLALPLVPMLTAADAKALLTEHEAMLEGQTPLPVQKQLTSALRKHSTSAK